MAKSALGKDPKTPETTKRGNWKYKGRWVNKDGFLVDNYGKVLPDQKNAFVPEKSNPFAKKKDDGKKAPPTPEQRIEKGLPSLVAGALGDARRFDPDTFQNKYEPQFEQGMQRAYNNIYDQFERNNAERFAREQQQLQQSLVERGLDPSGEAYKSMTDNLAKSQAAQRQEAQSAAWNAAQGYQQQGYQQAVGTALLPGQIQAPFLGMYSDELQRKFAAEQAELERQSREKLTKMGGGGGGGGGTSAADRAWIQWLMNQYPGGQQGGGQSNTNAAISGGAQGVGMGITAGLMK